MTDLKQSQGEPRALISRSALLHNVRLIRRAIAPGVKFCAVVKADGYGHGADIVVDTLCNFTTEANERQPNAEQLAVATIDEAAGLPQVDLPVLVFRPVENAFLGSQRTSIELAVQRGWILTIDSPAAAGDVARIAGSLGAVARLNIMLDTGMTRGGCDAHRLEELLRRIKSLPALSLFGIGTHLASSELGPDHESVREQLRLFRMASDDLSDVWPARVTRHAANSGAAFLLPETHFDMVRVGLSLYGIDPTCAPNLDRALRPVMKCTAPLIGIREIAPGTSVGYNQTWTARRATRVGLLPIGYADGYFRAFSNQALTLVHDVPCPVIGRVSMDLTTIDLTDAPHVAMGDEVTVLDDDPLSPASAYRLATLAKTIPYELFTRIGPRVRRVAID